jgi:alkanesulfonate monooxygenase SsuD/methylene tetrahydromethanopterin reductase-like flavin-dependent oxidoreductase (luciferase family)
MATYGLQLPDFSWIVGADSSTTMDRLRESAEAAEASGFSSMWVMDHLLQLPPLGATTSACVFLPLR